MKIYRIGLKYTRAERKTTVGQYYLYKKDITQDAVKKQYYADASAENTENAEELDNDLKERNEIIDEFVEQDEEEGFDKEIQ